MEKMIVRGTVLIAIVVVVTLVAGGALVLYARSRDSTTPLPLASVIARYESEVGQPGSARGPQPGVYLYDTSGGERVSALGGSSHSYPHVTTITIGRTPCGYTTRWDALKERWDEQRICTLDDGDALQSVAAFHQFFGRADRRDFQCTPASLARPRVIGPGARWSAACSAEGAEFRSTTTFIGIEHVAVGGTSVEAARYRAEITNTGSARGGGTHDVWLDPDTGLIVRRVVEIATTADSVIGDVDYREQYTMTLQSLTPRTDNEQVRE
jgi:hypothetical protein